MRGSGGRRRFRGGFGFRRFLVRLDRRGGDELVALVQVDQPHALGVAADDADVADRHADHLAAAR